MSDASADLNDKVVGTGVISFSDLVDVVIARRLRVEDHYEIAAVLESLGWNDQRATEVFGMENIFGLAEAIWEAVQSRVIQSPVAPINKLTTAQYLTLIIRSFLRGAIFALPMAVSVFSMLTLRFSLWSYIDLSVENATSIALGTILSFITVGGFTQAIGHWGFRYIGQGQYFMAQKLVFYFVRIGYYLCLLLLAGIFLFNLLFPIFPWQMVVIVAFYFACLSAIWLSVTIMYILRKELVFTGLLISGILIVYLLFSVLHLNIIVAQLVALVLVAVAGIIIAHFFFAREQRAKEKGIKPALPRVSIVMYTSFPFLTYGFLYFAFLFADRVIAWSTNDLYMPYPIWFRGQYELGLDLALIAFILPVGLVEVVINELMARLEADQRNYMASDSRQMNQLYLGLYSKRIALVALFSLVSALLLYLVLRVLSSNGILPFNFFDDVTHIVFILAVIGYAVLAVALSNVLLLFCLAQPRMVTRLIGIAFSVNVLLGFVLSRWIDYWWAVVGLLVGALIFAVLSTRKVRLVLKNLDYYLYSAA